MRSTFRGKVIASSLGLLLAAAAIVVPGAAASAYTLTGCSWGPYGNNVTWLNQAPSGDYYNTGTSAGYSWAANINGMSPRLHELGHALGLNHSGSNAVMYSCAACTGFGWPQSDDINGINSLY